MQFLLALQIRRVVMRKLLVGMVVLASAAGGVSACGNHEKAKATTPAAQPADVVLHNTTDATAVVKNDEPVVLEAEKGPKFTLVLEGKSGFKFRSAMLSDEAKAKIDEMFT